MKAFCTVAVASSILLLSATASAADQDHKAWMRYFAGNWKWSADNGDGGELELKLAASGSAVIGTGTGGKSAWIFGWDSSEKRIVTEWFDDTGNHGRVAYKIVDESTLLGPVISSTENGVTKANITVKKTGDNRFTVRWADVTVDGKKSEDLNLVVERK